MKITFFNTIKSKDTSTVYKDYLEMNEIFIPRKCLKKITPWNMEEQKKYKVKFNLINLSAQIEYFKIYVYKLFNKTIRNY